MVNRRAFLVALAGLALTPAVVSRVLPELLTRGLVRASYVAGGIIPPGELVASVGETVIPLRSTINLSPGLLRNAVFTNQDRIESIMATELDRLMRISQKTPEATAAWRSFLDDQVPR